MLQEFYKRVDMIMHMETAREAIYAGKSTLIEAPRETTQVGKSALAKKNGENKKRKSGDH